MRGLSEHQLLVFLVQFALPLGVARLLGALARRLGQPSVMGEVLTGSRFGIQAIPALAVFRDGREVERVAGALPLDELRRFAAAAALAVA